MFWHILDSPNYSFVAYKCLFFIFLFFFLLHSNLIKTLTRSTSFFYSSTQSTRYRLNSVFSKVSVELLNSLLHETNRNVRFVAIFARTLTFYLYETISVKDQNIMLGMTNI